MANSGDRHERPADTAEERAKEMTCTIGPLQKQTLYIVITWYVL